MSYILDALNKSEQERREQDNVPSLQAIHEDSGKGHSTPAPRRWQPILVAVVIVLLLAVIASMWMSSGPSETPNTESPVRLQSTAPQSKLVVPTEKPTNAVLPKVQTSKSDVDSLYSNPLSDDHNDSVAIVEPAQGTPVKTEAMSVQPTEQAEPAKVTTPKPRSMNGPNDLPDQLRARLPALIYTAHVYSSDENRGFAIINGRSRYKGDLLSDSLFVEAVVEDGVILNIQGHSFMLMAMKSWAQ
jgi:general secretion pathway protein B